MFGQQKILLLFIKKYLLYSIRLLDIFYFSIILERFCVKQSNEGQKVKKLKLLTFSTFYFYPFESKRLSDRKYNKGYDYKGNENNLKGIVLILNNECYIIHKKWFDDLY